MGEVQLLKEWINPLYLVKETIAQIPPTFYAHQELPSIQLSNFFLEEKAEQVRKVLDKLSWKKNYIPHMHSFHKPTNEKALASLYSLVNSPGFKALLGTMLKKEFKNIIIEPLLFQHGDYTLLHDAHEQEKGIVCYLDFTKHWSEDFWGQLIFTTKAEPIIFPRVFNAAHIVQITEDAQCFVKYVNSAAGKNKVYLVKVIMH